VASVSQNNGVGNAPDRNGLQEFAAGWSIVLGANLGIAVGVAALPLLSTAVFLRAFQKDFGWSRAEISFGPTIIILVTALLSPFIGMLADRIRPVWISIVGLAGLAVSLWMFGRLGGDIRTYYLSCAGLGLLAAGSGTVPYARAVTACFQRARGLALGMAMVGTGISAMLVPILLTPYSAEHGWRQGYVVLALIVIVATPVIGLLLLRQPIAGARARGSEPESGRRHLRDAMANKIFWLLAPAFFLIPLCLAGMHLHLLSYLGDAGVSPATAGKIVSSAGLVQIVSRIGSGWLVDRFFAPYVAAATVFLAGVGLAFLAAFGAPAAIFGSIAFGLAMGAEIDLIGYLTARYFAMESYGRVYGVFYGVTMCGAALSPVLFGAAFDTFKAYEPAFVMAAAGLILAALLFLRLPKYPADIV
jgi:MFS family permease